MERELLVRVVAAVNTTPVLSESNVLGNLRQHPIDSATEHLDLE
jgi:hypothetical protein